jgi:hypothetical protein
MSKEILDNEQAFLVFRGRYLILQASSSDCGSASSEETR